jgi:hypothetical protein
MSDAPNAVSVPNAELEAARAAARAKLDSAKTITPNVSAKSTEKSSDTRNDTQLLRDIANTLKGVFKIVRVLSKIFGKKDIPPLTDDEAKDGAASFLPLARRFSFIASLTIWIGAPIWLFATIDEKWKQGKPVEPNAPTKEPAKPQKVK